MNGWKKSLKIIQLKWILGFGCYGYWNLEIEESKRLNICTKKLNDELMMVTGGMQR